VPGARAGGHWRIVVEAVHYWRIVVGPARYRLQRVPYAYGPGDVEYVINQRPGPGTSGMVVVMTRAAAADRVAGRVLADYAAAAGAVLVLLAVAALAVTQAILRPLRQAAKLADSAAAGRFPRVMPHGGARAGAAVSHWPFGRALMTVPEQLRASQAAEAVARRSADEMSKRLGETALELRRSVSVVRGFAEYRRQRPELPAAGLDRMLRRVADEAARMEMLIDGLSRAHPQDPPEPAPRPARRAPAPSGPPR
jgi:two-component system OmpR family sensor kinase